jgi:hypothetical protein
MTSYSCFGDLEASIPLSRLSAAVAFGQCAAHLPDYIDSLCGDELVRSLETDLSLNSKARVVL